MKNLMKKFLAVFMLVGLLLIPTTSTKSGFFMPAAEARAKNVCQHTGFVGGWCAESTKCRTNRKMVYCWQQIGGGLCCEEECATLQQCP